MRRINRIVAIAAVMLMMGAAWAGAEDEPADVSGDWELTWQGRQGPHTVTANFERDGEKLIGAFSSGQGRQEELIGTIVGNQISFRVSFQGRRDKITLHFKGEVDGDTMKGTVEAGKNSREWTAKRKGA